MNMILFALPFFLLSAFLIIFVWRIIPCETIEDGLWFHNPWVWKLAAAAIVYLILAAAMSMYHSRYISQTVMKLQKDMMVDQVRWLMDQQEQYDEEKRVLELQALQSQINPHFLYNTLATIRFLTEMDEKERAQKSLVALVKLMKRTFSDHRKLIPLSEEMEALQQYLVLMENRYPDTFRWEIQMDNEVKNCLIPRISIQPLAENAISHGLDQKTGDGHLRIKAEKKMEKLVIRVWDDGENADLERIREILKNPSPVGHKEQVSGIGIRNVHERLKLFFGDGSGMTVEEEDGGTCFVLCLPAYEEDYGINI